MTNQLYPDLFEEISTYLDPEDIRRFGLVSKDTYEGTARELYKYQYASIEVYGIIVGKRRYNDVYICMKDYKYKFRPSRYSDKFINDILRRPLIYGVTDSIYFKFLSGLTDYYNGGCQCDYCIKKCVKIINGLKLTFLDPERTILIKMSSVDVTEKVTKKDWSIIRSFIHRRNPRVSRFHKNFLK
jgi:hypothetical protein